MKKSFFIFIFIALQLVSSQAFPQKPRARELGIKPGFLETGKYNAITDVEGVRVGQVTIVRGPDVRTGVTAILPYPGNIMARKVPAAMYIANGFGKMTGYSQVEELGNIETPVILTNTLSVPTAADALIDYILGLEENRKYIRSINPIVGETNDGYLNDIQGRHVEKSHVLEAIGKAASGPVAEGSVGAGTGTVCFGYKGGIGTSSRILSPGDGEWTVGVLVQTNFGGDLMISGVPVKRVLEKGGGPDSGDGSCMIVVATDAPLTSRNLKRLAKRAVFGLARVGGNCSNGSGEYVIAFSTAEGLRIPHNRGESFVIDNRELRNDRMTPLFTAVIEATEEAVLNSLFAGEDMEGYGGHAVKGFPVDEAVRTLVSRGVVQEE